MIGFLAGFLGTALLTSRRTTTKKSNIVRPKVDTLAGSGGVSSVVFKNSNLSLINNINSSYSLLAGRTRYVGNPVTDGFLWIVYGIEQNYKVDERAKDDGAGNPTLGIGNYKIFNDAGNFDFTVKWGHTLQMIKNRYGRPHQDSREFCFSLLRNYYKKNDIHKVWAELDKMNFPYIPELAEAIQDFYFNSGGPYGKKDYREFLANLNSCKNFTGMQLRNAVARFYVRYRLNYLRGNTKKMYAHWIRRTLIFADRLIGERDMEEKLSWKVFPTTNHLKNRLLKYNYSY